MISSTMTGGPAAARTGRARPLLASTGMASTGMGSTGMGSTAMGSARSHEKRKI